MPATGSRTPPGAYKGKGKKSGGRPAASRGGRTPSEAALGRSMAASGRAVSRSNLRQSRPSQTARRSPLLQIPDLGGAVERLRRKYADPSLDSTRGGRTQTEAIRRDQGITSRKEKALDKAAVAQIEVTPADNLVSLTTRQDRAKRNTGLSNDGKSVKRFRGMGIVGTPEVASVTDAANTGQLRKQGKRLTTPEVRGVQGQVRRAKRQLRRARAAAQRSGRINLPGGEGVFINELARQTKMDPRVLAAWTRSEGGNSYGDYNLLNIGHTGSGPNSAASNADYADPKAAAKATAAFLRGEWGSPGADIPYIVQRARGKDPATQIRVIEQSGWRLGSPGPDPTYNTLISGVYNDMPAASKPNPRARARLQQAKGRAASVARKAADLGLSVQGLVTPRQVKAMGLKLERAPIKPTLWAQPKKAKGEGTVTWLNGTSPNGVNPDIIALGRTISRMTGQDIQITSALRPTDSDSNHSEGGALDINAVADGGAGERAGDAIAYSAVIAAGGTREQAEALASGQAGIVQFTSPNGHSMELLWKGDPDHRDHVHIAVETAARGKKVFRGRKAVGQGALSGPTDVFLGGGGGGSSGGVAPVGGSTSSAPAKKKRRQTDVLKLLRQLGYSITSSGIKRTGLAASMNPSDAPTSVTTLKRRYGVE